MSKEEEYTKNTVILLIGKFSSQVISFLLIPLYTYKLSTANYGYVDLIQTYISLLAPVMLLQLDSAVFRYLIDYRDNEVEKFKVISSSFICVVVMLFFSSIVFIIINLIWKIEFGFLIIFCMLTTVINTYVMSIVRGTGHNKTYAIASIIFSLTMLIINIVLILIIKINAKSILIATIISNIISSGYCFYKEKIYRSISINSFDRKKIGALLKYSIPMIPNVLSWWIVGLSDRTIIAYFIGTAANGIYAISCKFSNLLNAVFSIFNMSWQESASLHINDQNVDDFFSKMITNIFNFFLVASCGIAAFLPIVYDVIIGKEYMDAYYYIPILLTANVCNVIVGLLGGIYVSKKMTKKVAITTVYSAIINIIINISFVTKIGLYAACLSTLLSYLLILIYRYYDISKMMKISLCSKKTIIYLLFFLIIILCYYIKQKLLGIVFGTIVLSYFIVVNKSFIFENAKKIVGKVKNIG